MASTMSFAFASTARSRATLPALFLMWGVDADAVLVFFNTIFVPLFQFVFANLTTAVSVGTKRYV